MDDVSQYDEQPPPDDGDTQPLHPSGQSYPPPYGHQPPPSDRPYGQQGPPQSPPGPQGPPPTAPYQTPYAPPYPPGQPPRPPQRAQGPTARMPGWAWPVLTVLALVVGSLGGVVAATIVSETIAHGNRSSLPVIGGTDNGAASPLKADNGSIAAVAAKVLPSTVQIQANGGADGSPGGGATGSGFVLDSQDHVITNNHVVADATGPGDLKVVDRAGKKHDAKIIGRSPVYDIAVLAVSDPSGLKPAAIGSSAAHAGR